MLILYIVLIDSIIEFGPSFIFLFCYTCRVVIVEDSDIREFVRTARTTYTVEEAVEMMGVGRFQIKLWCIVGLFSVSWRPPLHPFNN